MNRDLYRERSLNSAIDAGLALTISPQVYEEIFNAAFDEPSSLLGIHDPFEQFVHVLGVLKDRDIIGSPVSKPSAIEVAGVLAGTSCANLARQEAGVVLPKHGAEGTD